MRQASIVGQLRSITSSGSRRMISQSFLGYQNPEQAVRSLVPCEAWKSWEELRGAMGQHPLFPPNWQPHTVLISEGGLYRLLCKSTKPAAIKFERWVFDEVLPTVRETGTYTIHQHLQFLTQQLAINPLPVQFKALLHGQKGCVFFSVGI